MLRTEGVDAVFEDDAVEAIARIAEEVNNRTENIGARRLHTIMERLLEDPLFDADVNVKGFINLLEASRKNDVKKT